MTKLHEAAAASMERDQAAGGGGRRKRKTDESRSRSSSPSSRRALDSPTITTNPFDSPDRPSVVPPDFNSVDKHHSPPRVNSIRDFRLNLPPPSFVFNASPPRSLNSTPSSSSISSPPPSQLPFMSPPKLRRFTSERRPSAEETNPVAARLYAKELASHHASGLSTSSAGSLASTPSGWRSPDGIFGPSSTSAGPSGLHKESTQSKDILQVFALDEEEALSSPDDQTFNSPPPPSSSRFSHTPAHPSSLSHLASTSSSSSALPHIRILSSSTKPSILLQARKRDVLKTLLFLLLLQLQSLKSRFSLLPTISLSNLNPLSSSSSKPKPSSSSSSSSREVAKQRSKSDFKAILFAALFLAFRGWGGVLLGEDGASAFGAAGGGGGGLGGMVGEWGGKVVRGLVGLEVGAS